MATKSRKIVVYVATAVNASVAISKFIAAYFTGSSAMIAEGIHSMVDTGDSLLLLLGIHRSRKPPDKMHPFGHGKELYFWALIVAIVIFGVGGGMSIYEGIMHLLHPEPIRSLTWNYWVLGIAAVLDGASWTLAIREFLRIKQPGAGFWATIHASKDPTVFTVLIEDSADLLGLLLAFIGVTLGHYLKNPIYDGAASILIGLLLASLASVLAYESKGLLVGESTDVQVVESIRKIAEADPAVQRAAQPLTMQLAPHQVLLNLDIQFCSGLSVEELETAVNRLEQAIRQKHSDVIRIFIEAHALSSAI